MTVTQRGRLAPEDELALKGAVREWQKAEAIRAAVRDTCVQMVERSSFREVERLTGFSTNTLQRWKREAGQ